MELVPVILGGDVGAYTLGLECYEAFGVKSICVSAAPIDMITKSVIFEVEQVTPQASDEELLAVLRGIAAIHQNLLLLANTDAHVSFFARHREELSQHYLLPFPTTETIDLLCQKQSFAEVCAREGVPTPATVVVDLAEEADPEIDFTFPVVAKTASGAAYDRVSFPGKKKIWFIDSPEELTELWSTLRGAGFRDKFVVQENIPGDDTYMRSLTYYVSSTGEILLRAGAHVLLQDPSPTMIGNPVAMITRELPDLWELGDRILRAGNYTGFANFDIKIDPRDGTPYFLEVNPRIGRNSYYVVAAGQNPMAVMAQDLFLGESPDPVVAQETALYSLVPFKLILQTVKDPDLLAEVKTLPVVDPLDSPIETSKSRKAVARLQKLNYLRKFRRYAR